MQLRIECSDGVVRTANQKRQWERQKRRYPLGKAPVGEARIRNGEVLSYFDYISSSHWNDLKDRYRKSKLIQCCVACGSVDNLHYHHKSYKRLGHERLSDIVPLCRAHHEAVHVLTNRGKSLSLATHTIISRSHKKLKLTKSDVRKTSKQH